MGHALLDGRGASRADVAVPGRRAVSLFFPGQLYERPGSALPNPLRRPARTGPTGLQRGLVARHLQSEQLHT